MDELVAIQQTDTGVPFQMNERNARELVKLLVDKGKLDGVFTQSGDFLMTNELKKNILTEIKNCGGRTSIQDLHTILGIDVSYIDRGMRAIAADSVSGVLSTADGAVRMIGGEIVSEWYLQQTLSGEMCLFIEQQGITTIGAIAKRFSITMDIVGELVRAGIAQNRLSASVKRNRIVTKKHEMTQARRIRGICTACTRTISIEKIMKLLDSEMDEVDVMDALKSLCSSGDVSGAVRGRSYVPALHTSLQRSCLHEFYSGNGYIEFSRAKKLNVSKPEEELKRLFPDSILLQTVAINPGYLSDFVSQVESFALDSSLVSPSVSCWPSALVGLISSGILPTFLSRDDVAMLHQLYISEGSLFNVAENKNTNDYGKPSAVSKIKTHLLSVDGIYITTSWFMSWITSRFTEDARVVGEFIGSLLAPIGASKSIVVTSRGGVDSAVLAEEMVKRMRGLSAQSSRLGAPNSGLKHLSSEPEPADGVDPSVEGDVLTSAPQLGEASSWEHWSAPEDVRAVSLAKEVYDKLAQSAARPSDLECHVSKLVSPFISVQRVRSLLDRFTSMGGDEAAGCFPPDNWASFAAAVWTLIEPTCRSAYEHEAKLAVCKCSQAGGGDGDKAYLLEEVRNSCFTTMWAELQIVAKGLGALEARKIESYRPTKSPGPVRIVSLHKHVLSTRCAAISALLTMQATWNTEGVPLLCFQQDISDSCVLSEENRLYIRKFVPRDKAIVLLNLWEICKNKDGSNTVWNFMDVIVTTASSVLSLVASGGGKSSSLWTLDRKKDRLTTANIKNVRVEWLLKLSSEWHSVQDSSGSGNFETVQCLETGSCLAASLCLFESSLKPTFAVVPGGSHSGTAALIDVPWDGAIEVLERVVDGFSDAESSSSSHMQVCATRLLQMCKRLQSSLLEGGEDRSETGGTHAAPTQPFFVDLVSIIDSIVAILK